MRVDDPRPPPGAPAAVATDRDILARRRDERRTLLTGHRWAGEREGPIARSAEADRLAVRALVWVATHPQ